MEIISSVVVRIRRHDAICDIIYEALLLDNQSVKREQSASSQSRNRPGDTNGHPTFFDISVCNLLLLATSPLLLLEQPVCAKKLIKMVSTSLRWKGQVHALYLWSLTLWGLWSSFARKILKQIASKTIIFNHLHTPEALKYLIQRISTTLWSFNARMLMQRLATLTV